MIDVQNTSAGCSGGSFHLTGGSTAEAWDHGVVGGGGQQGERVECH